MLGLSLILMVFISPPALACEQLILPGVFTLKETTSPHPPPDDWTAAVERGAALSKLSDLAVLERLRREVGEVWIIPASIEGLLGGIATAGRPPGALEREVLGALDPDVTRADARLIFGAGPRDLDVVGLAEYLTGLANVTAVGENIIATLGLDLLHFGALASVFADLAVRHAAGGSGSVHDEQRLLRVNRDARERMSPLERARRPRSEHLGLDILLGEARALVGEPRAPVYRAAFVRDGLWIVLRSAAVRAHPLIEDRVHEVGSVMILRAGERIDSSRVHAVIPRSARDARALERALAKERPIRSDVPVTRARTKNR